MSDVATSVRRSSRIHGPVSYATDSDSDSDSGGSKRANTEPVRRARKKSRQSIQTDRGITSLSQNPASEKSQNSHDSQDSQEQASELENALYNELCLDSGPDSSESSIDQVALDFLNDYREEPAKNLYHLINFIIKASGGSVGLSEDQIANTDEAATIFKRFEKNLIDDYPVTDYPLLNKCTSKRAHVNILQFTSSLVDHASEYEMLYLKDEKLLTDSLTWIAVFSGSSIRSFRHVSTLIGLSVLTKLCEIHNEQSSVLRKYEKQMASLSKSKKSKKAAKAAKLGVEELIKTQHLKLAILDEFITDIFSAIFVHRQKDVDGKIRAECIQGLGKLILIYPERFLENQYLRYFGWALSDLHNTTRQTVVVALTNLYKNAQFQPSMRQFTERFLPRLIEMATIDIDNNVRKYTIDLLTLVQNAGFLDQESCSKVAILIFDSDSRIRRAAAQFFVSHVEKRIENEVSKLSKDDVDEANVGVTFEWIRFIVLANALEETYKARLSYHQTNLPGYPPHFMEQVRDIMLDERYYGASYTPILATAASAIFATLKADSPLKDWSQLIDLLLFDFSSITDNISLSRNIRQFIEYISPEDSQISLLLDTLRGFISANAEEAKTKYRKRKPSNRSDENPPVVEDVYVMLLNNWDAIFEKYHYDSNFTAKTIGLISLVDYDIYAALHKEADAETMFQKALKEFSESINESVLIECSNIFSRCCQSTRFTGFVKPKLYETAQDLTLTLGEVVSEIDIDDLSTLSHLPAHLSRLLLLSQSVSISENIAYFLDRNNRNLTLGGFLNELLLELPASEPAVASMRGLLLMRNYALWFLAAYSKGESDGYGLEADIFRGFLSTLQNLLETLVKDLPSSDRQLSSIAATVLLEVYTAAKFIISARHSSTELTLEELPEAVEKAVITIFHDKEKAYAISAGIELEDGSDSTSEYVRDEFSQSDNAMMLCDYDLCKYAAKMKLASLGGVFQRECVDAVLRANVSVLSINYRAVVKE